ncbi:Pol II transcription elongation factor subunit Cdc73, putative [Cordyceps militaris CM01]|uniref:Pol II transcription elongation factor subunit Cdc73, putative n=1 Tax=Cordyceps militaris (strain CM01) TaxID=983644 RepID=G3JM53_CORMM|nr:Pol II transcription elongation factor subunit Cdc73, putative [Cordyceps militaris CM01]EGX90777.1 Pol II transcription elongation factor subunit Cdc73, putative [Cordyceps militaris CM01]
MAVNEQDPLLRLRQVIAAGQAIVPSASSEAGSPEVGLAQASHLLLADAAPSALRMDAPTRFISSDQPVDLRSIYFAWLNRELAIPEYNAAAATLNAELGAAGARVQNLGFIERLDLITWLEGASDESEYIKPLVGDAEAAAAAAAAPATKAGAAAAAAVQARSGKGTLDPRLASIYDGERRMGDRNTVLRGVKPTDFSHVRKLAEPFLQRKTQSTASLVANTALSLNQKGPQRRPDPIILLSPSASSLLRMSNARSFLEDGKFVPPDAGASTVSMLHVQRVIRSVDPHRPMRFILVEGPEQFKPEYWNRVAAVFTTGQTWQFKNYKWSNPNELFKHVQGIFVGWRGDLPPDPVRDWGHRVLAAPVDRWRGHGLDSSRFRDKEAVESIWNTIELNMRSKGWRKDAAPTAI